MSTKKIEKRAAKIADMQDQLEKLKAGLEKVKAIKQRIKDAKAGHASSAKRAK